MNSQFLNKILRSCGHISRQRNLKLLLYEWNYNYSNSVKTIKDHSVPFILAHRRFKSTVARPKYPSSIMTSSQQEDLLAKPEKACPEETQFKVIESDGWITVGQYSVFAWTVSGLESCVVIKSDDINVVFDMGIAIPESIKASTVFITHGHVDHIGAVVSHVSKRGLNGMKPARYFVPPHLVEPMKSVLHSHYLMAETVEALKDVNIAPIVEGDCVRLNSSYFVKAFPTVHRIPSQGYILYREEKKLKEELRGLQGFEIAALHREGKEIHDIVVTPEVAYCGDTIFEFFFKPPTPDLLKVNLLITETTFLDEEEGKSMVQKAKDRGHTHLSELIQNAELFKDVGHIILVHFSNKYCPKYIRDCLHHNLPPQLKNKVTPATVAKATWSQLNCNSYASARPIISLLPHFNL